MSAHLEMTLYPTEMDYTERRLDIYGPPLATLPTDNSNFSFFLFSLFVTHHVTCAHTFQYDKWLLQCSVPNFEIYTMNSGAPCILINRNNDSAFILLIEEALTLQQKRFSDQQEREISQFRHVCTPKIFQFIYASIK